MIRIGNIGGIFAIIYLCWNPWSISINHSSIISRPVVQVIELLHPIIIGLIICSILSIYIYSLLTENWEIGLYVLSVFLLVFIITIAINMAMLKNSTTTILFTIHHPVPLDVKLSYFESELFKAIKLNSPELLANMDSLLTIKRIINQELTREAIASMDAKEIHDIVYTILNKYNIWVYNRKIDIIRAIALFLLALFLRIVL